MSLSTNLKTIRTWALMLFLILLPTQFGTHFFLDFSYINGIPVDYLSIGLLVTDLIVILLLLLDISIIQNHFKKNIKIHLLLLGIFCINIFQSQYPLLALYGTVKLYEIFFVYLIFKSSRLTIKQFFLPLITGALIQLILASLQLSSKGSLQGIFYYLGERFMTSDSIGIAKASLLGHPFLRPYGTFSHPNSLGGFYLLLYATSLALIKKTKFAIPLLIIAGALVLLSFSKSAIITLIAITVFFLFTQKKPCWPCTFGKLFILGIIGFIFTSVKSDPLTIEKRLVLMSQSFSIIKEHLFFGTGILHHLFSHSQFPSQYSYFFNQPVHNIFLLLLMQMGIFLFAGILYVVVKEFSNTNRANWAKSTHTTLLLIPILAVLITGMADHYWATLQQNILILGVVFGYLKTTSKSEQGK